MKNLLLLLSLLLCAAHCDPPMNCTYPDCVSSPISFQLYATINDTSQILQIDDTLKMYIKIPDTIQTNEGNFYIADINQDGTWFSIEYYLFDSIYSDGSWQGESPTTYINHVTKSKSKNGLVYFDVKKRESEIHFTFPRKGKYYIAMKPQAGRFVFREKSKDWILAMFNVDLDVRNQHHDLYLSWIPNLEQRVSMSHELSDRKRRGLFWYAFEVK